MSRFILERYGCFWKNLEGENFYALDDNTFENDATGESFEVVKIISEDEVEVDIKK